MTDTQLLDFIEKIRDGGFEVENAGFGIYGFDDDNNIVIPWWQMALDPAASSAHVSTNMIESMIASEAAGYNGRINFQFHTHCRIGSFFSTTDHNGCHTMVKAQQDAGMTSGSILFLVIDEMNWWGTIVAWDGSDEWRHPVEIVWRGKPLDADHPRVHYTSIKNDGVQVYRDGKWSKWDGDDYPMSNYGDGRQLALPAGEYEDDLLAGAFDDWDDELYAGTWSKEIHDYLPLIRLLTEDDEPYATTFAELYELWRRNQVARSIVNYDELIEDTDLWDTLASVLGEQIEWWHDTYTEYYEDLPRSI